FGCRSVGQRRFPIVSSELEFGIQAAKHAGGGKQVHRCVGDAFLNELHIQDRFAIRINDRLTATLKLRISRPSAAANGFSSPFCTGTSGTRTVAPSRCLPALHAFAMPRSRVGLIRVS